MNKDIKLEIDINQKIYIPGNVVEGVLRLTNFKNLIVSSLKLILIGEIKTNFNVNNIIVFNENEDIFKIILYYDFINNKFIYENFETKFLLEVQEKDININILIPDIKLPSTYDSKYCSISYQFIVVLDYRKLLNSRKIKNDIIYKNMKIKIIPLIYTFDDIYLIPIIMKIYTNINHKKICGIFNYSLFIPHQCYLPGDKILLELKLDNLTNVNNCILILKIKLEKQLSFTKFFNYIIDKNNVFIYNKILIHNKNNDTIIRLKDLQIPYNCNYTILSNSTKNLFEINYFLKVNITILKDKKHIPLKNSIIPIIVGSYRTDYNDINKIPFLPKY